MACIFGGNSSKAAAEVGAAIMTDAQKVDAGIGSFDVVSVTEDFADKTQAFYALMEVTAEANSLGLAMLPNLQLLQGRGHEPS